MGSYTMTLKECFEMWTLNQAYSTKDRIEKGRQLLFDFDYPIFDENYRSVFETHFIRNFYFREIGFETEGRFKFELESWLNLHMPYFNKLFESELLSYNPLQNTETDETYNRKNNKEQTDNRDISQTSNTDETLNQKTDQTSNMNGTTHSTTDETTSDHETGTKDVTGERTQDNFNRKLYSDNPDSRLALTETDGEGTISYASNITEDSENNQENTTSNTNTTTDSNGEVKSTSDTTSSIDTTSNSNTDLTSSTNVDTTKNDKLTSEINDTEDYIQHYVGKIGSITYPEMVMKYRESFLRIEKSIFNEMNQLFMLVY